MDDLDFGVRNVVFEAKVFNQYATFDQTANRSMEDLNYAHLHCDLLDKVALTTITLKGVKSPHRNIHEQHACCYYSWVDDHYVINHFFSTRIGSHVFPHGFH
jgi:hypothetical protein